MDSRQLMKRAPSSDLVIFVMVMTAPFFGGMAELLDMKKCTLDLLRVFVSKRYEASLWTARTMCLALYVMIASGWEAA